MLKKVKFFYSLILFTLIFFSIISPLKIYAKEIDEPILNSKRAISIDIDTNEVIYSKNSNEKAQCASTTKLITALLLSENKKKTDSLIYTENSMKQPSSSIFTDYKTNLKVNDKISANDVMNSLLLHSANDMATLISENLAKDINSYNILMDKKTKEIGMKNTNFYTPSGLDSDDILQGQSHYTTAYDMGLLAIEAFKSPWIRETMAKKNNIKLNIPSETPILLSNTNSNLNKNGCIGGKTGYTDKAGNCLVNFYERDGKKIVGVILGASSRSDSFKDMSNLINYSYKTNKKTLYKKGDLVDTKVIEYKPFIFFGPPQNYEIDLLAKKDIKLYSNEINNSIKPTITLEKYSPWKLSKKNTIAKLNYKSDNINESFELFSNTSIFSLVLDVLPFYLISLTLIAIAFIIFKKLKRN